MKKPFNAFLLFLLLPVAATAMEDSITLPKGVRAAIFVQGQVLDVEQKFSDDNELLSLQGRFSKKIDANFLQKQLPDFQRLMKVLSTQFPKNYNIGEEIDLGNLELKGKPQMDVFAPIFAYGFTNNWSIGIGLPLVHLQAKVDVSSTGSSNVAAVREKIFTKSGFSPELEDAFERLENVDIEQEFYNTLDKKSYKPFRQVDQWVVGDLQVQSRWKYRTFKNWDFALKTHINFPTGPEDDPDDLLDVPIFHRSSLELMQVNDYRFNSKLRSAFGVGFKWNIPDQITKRVPEFQDDYLPDISRKENLRRDIGDAWKWEWNLRYALSEAWSLGFAYLSEHKAADVYEGNQFKGDYHLLSNKTEVFVDKIELQLSFNTVKGFLKKKYSVPFFGAYRYSDTVRGKNVERQQFHILSVGMVF